MPVRLPHGNQLVALVQPQGPYPHIPDVLQRRHRQTLYRAVAGNHHQEQIRIVQRSCVNDRLNFLSLLHRKHVDNIGPLGRLAGLRYLIAFLPIDPAGVGEEEQIIVGRRGEHIRHIILVPGGDALAALSALGLGGVLTGGGPLDVPRLGEGKDTLLFFNQVFNVDVVLGKADLCLTVVAVLVPDLLQLGFQHPPEHLFIGQELVEIGNLLFQLGILRLQLLPVQPLERNEPHVTNRLGLHVVQLEPLHQPVLRVVVAGTDNPDDLVNVVLGNEQTFDQMRPLLGFPAVKDGPAGDDLLLEGDVFVQNLPQGQGLGLFLVVHQRQHYHRKRGLHLGLGKQTVQHHLGVCVFLQLNDDAHPLLAVGLVPQAGNAF